MELKAFQRQAVEDLKAAMAVPGKREMAATAFLNGVREVPEIRSDSPTPSAERPHHDR